VRRRTFETFSLFSVPEPTVASTALLRWINAPYAPCHPNRWVQPTARLGPEEGAGPRRMVDALKNGKKMGRFPNRQVSTKGTDEAKVEALSFAHLRKFCKKFSGMALSLSKKFLRDVSSKCDAQSAKSCGRE
jgi:hypothetical protein